MWFEEITQRFWMLYLVLSPGSPLFLFCLIPVKYHDQETESTLILCPSHLSFKENKIEHINTKNNHFIIKEPQHQE